MKPHVALQLGFVVLFSAVSAAQQSPAAPKPPASGPPVPSPPSTVTTRPAPTVDLSAGGQLVNIRLEISIVDQAGSAAVSPKLLTLLLADRSLSQVRSSFDDRTIRIDARPTIVESRIRVSLTIASEKPFQPLRAEDRNESAPSWNQSLTVLVENGKPLVAVENSDAATNRKLTIEIKATILK